MENRSRTIVIGLIAVVALVGGFGLGALLTGNRGGASGTPSPSAVAGVTDEPTTEPTEVPVTDEPTDEPTDSTEPGASASPSASPAPPATITINSLFIDAKDNPDGADRVITFTSATGKVKVKVTSVTPQGDLRMCLKTATKTLGCRTAGSGTLSATTTKAKETFIVTLRGADVAQPIVDVQLDFQARKPKVTIDNARFDGTAYPDTNGIQATITPRVSGSVGITAEWGGHPFLYEIDLIEQGGTGSVTYQPETGNVGTDLEFAVTAPNPWKLVLQNTESGNGITPMTASITWP